MRFVSPLCLFINNRINVRHGPGWLSNGAVADTKHSDNNMKKSSLLNIVLAVALASVIAKMAFFSSEGKAPAKEAVIDNIMTRVSVRAYQDRNVNDSQVDTLLRAAMAAPSAGNKQPWKLLVIRDKNTLHEISANMEYMKMAEQAPVAIVICGDMTNTFPEDGRDFWAQDASAATENMLLAAHSMGLGAVWCGIYPMKERVDFFKNLLQLPGNIVPLSVTPIGYPAEEPAPKDKWKPENIHYERWGGKAAATN